MFGSLREFVQRLMETGDLLVVEDEVSPVHELAYALQYLAGEGGPAALFRNVGGHRVPVVGNLFGTRRRIAVALGAETSDLLEECRHRLHRRLPPAVAAGSSPVQEVVVTGDIDLGRLLPLLTHSEGDSGPYLTSAVAVARDPATGCYGMGIHRIQVMGPARFSIFLENPPLATFAQRAAEKGGTLEVALVVGPDPATFLASVVPAAPGEDKFEVAGALRGEPVRLVPCRTISVAVPAEAEFVVEGVVRPAQRETDGPFGESSGYYLTCLSPVGEVTAVTHRRDPVYHALAPFSTEVSHLLSLSLELRFAGPLRERFPSVNKIRYRQLGMVAVVQLGGSERDEPRAVLREVLSAHETVKIAVAVDEDVDPDADHEIEWALATRFQPEERMLVIPDAGGWVIDPSYGRVGRGSKLGLDATVPAGKRDFFRKVDVPAAAKCRVADILKSFQPGGRVGGKERGRVRPGGC